MIRTYNILRLLARTFDITALCFYRVQERPTSRDVETSIRGLRDLASVQVFPIPQEHKTSRLLWDHFRSVVLRRAYTAFVYQSSAFRTRLEELLRTTEFDLAHIDSLDLCAYLPLLEGIPVVCVHHDAQSVLLRRRSAVEASRWRRSYVAHQAALMEREERRWCERVALNVTVSPIDEATLRRLAPRGNFTVVPNGVDVEKFRPESGRHQGIVFVGSTGWFPNRDALIYFCAEILPLIREAGETAPVRWVGRAADDEQRTFRETCGVELTGYVDDIRPWVRDAACYIVPLRVGGGTRVKILDAWAMGKAIVSTSIGCEGLRAVDGENILIRDTPSEFASAVRQVLQDAQLRQRLGRAARRTAEEIYSWDVIGISMLAQYIGLLRTRDAAPSEPDPRLGNNDPERPGRSASGGAGRAS